MFVAKLDAAGNHLWSKRFGDTDRQDTRGVAVDAAGNVFVTGGISGGPIDFGGGTLAAIGDGDAFLLSLDAGGAHQWSKRWGRANVYVGSSAVTVDAAGNVIVAGFAQGDTNLGTGQLPYKGGLDVVVGKFSAAGTPLFAHSYGTPTNDAASAVATDGAGNILLTGYTEGAIDFGNGPIPHVGRGTFITRLTPSGAPLPGAIATGTSALGRGIAADAQGNIFTAGYFTGSITLGGLPLTSASFGEEVYVAKIAP